MLSVTLAGYDYLFQHVEDLQCWTFVQLAMPPDGAARESVKVGAPAIRHPPTTWIMLGSAGGCNSEEPIKYSNTMNGRTIESCENAFLLRKRASEVVLSGPSDAVETKSHGRNDPGPSGAGSSPLLSNGGCAFVRTDNAAGATRTQTRFGRRRSAAATGARHRASA